MKSLFLALPLAFILVSCGDESKEPETQVVHDNHADTQTTSNIATPPADMNTDPKVFYYDYDEQRGTEEGIPMTKEDAIAELKKLPETDGNFFGMELADGKIVQFMYDGNKKTWFLDIPNPVTQESFNVDLTLDDAVKITGDVFDGKSAEDIHEAYDK